MQEFRFFYDPKLSYQIFSISDNLSKTIQDEKMSAVSGLHLAELTIETYQQMQNGGRDMIMTILFTIFSLSHLSEADYCPFLMYKMWQYIYISTISRLKQFNKLKYNIRLGSNKFYLKSPSKLSNCSYNYFRS